MKFATILDGDRQRFGLVDGDALHLAPAGETLRSHLAGDLAALAQRLRGLPATPLEGVTWAPVVPDPAQILCVGLNYKDHREETRSVTGGAYPEHPIIFTRFATTLAAHGETLPIPRVSEVVDYEAELAVIIGKGGRGISKADALDHVWGYTILNDVTARDIQGRHSQWLLGKSQDTFGPMGPWAVTRDEIDLASTGVRCWINGELRQDANTADLIFDVPTLIETISQGITLVPGDIIATGTPAGVGIGYKPPKYLRDGDVMKIEISGIGVLENQVRETAA